MAFPFAASGKQAWQKPLTRLVRCHLELVGNLAADLRSAHLSEAVFAGNEVHLLGKQVAEYIPRVQPLPFRLKLLLLLPVRLLRVGNKAHGMQKIVSLRIRNLIQRAQNVVQEYFPRPIHATKKSPSKRIGKEQKQKPTSHCEVGR